MKKIMEVYCVCAAKCEICTVIRFLTVRGNKPSDIHRKLKDVYSLVHTIQSSLQTMTKMVLCEKIEFHKHDENTTIIHLHQYSKS